MGIVAETGFLLIPGGGMGAWIWERITPLLSYPSICVDERADYEKFSSKRKITIDDCAAHAASLAENSNFKKIITVGHSGGGCIVEKTVYRLKNRAAAMVFISANIPPQGRRTVDVFPFGIKMMNLISVKLMGLGMMPSKKQYEKMLRNYLCTSCSEESITFALGNPMKIEPSAVVTERIYRPEIKDIKKFFIKLSRDKTATLAFQERMIKNLGGAREFVIDTDHMPMLSRPKELADILNSIAKSV